MQLAEHNLEIAFSQSFRTLGKQQHVRTVIPRVRPSGIRCMKCFLNPRTQLLDREVCDAILVIELQHFRPTLLKLRGYRSSQFLWISENDWLRVLPESKEVDFLMFRGSPELEIDLTTDLFEVSGQFKSEPTRGREYKRQRCVQT